MKILEVTLADGSQVTLNTGTQLRVSITEHERRAELASGEAYFEIAKDPSRPFVVKAGERLVFGRRVRGALRPRV